METAIFWIIGLLFVVWLFSFAIESAVNVADYIWDLFESIPWYITAPIALILFIWIAYTVLNRFQWYRELIALRKSVICPYCDAAVLFVADWECQKCGIMQGTERAADEPCLHCGVKGASIWCGECKKEILL